MFKINNGSIYKRVVLEQDNTSVEVGAFREDDHAGQANFVMETLNSLYHLTTEKADDIVKAELCKKYNLVDPEKTND
jgi:hypothetical protein